MINEEDLIKEALSWVGTPYHHQASSKQIGCDCLGLLLGLFRAFGCPDPSKDIPTYGPGWDEVIKSDQMLRTAKLYMKEKENKLDLRATNVLIFRMRPQASAKHCGILLSEKEMIHAQSNREVCLITLNEYWKKKIVGNFLFPGVEV